MQGGEGLSLPGCGSGSCPLQLRNVCPHNGITPPVCAQQLLCRARCFILGSGTEVMQSKKSVLCAASVTLSAPKPAGPEQCLAQKTQPGGLLRSFRVQPWPGQPFPWDIQLLSPGFGNQCLLLVCFCILCCHCFLNKSLSLLTGTLLSMGFGFVEYKKPESAQKALRRLQVSASLASPEFFPEAWMNLAVQGVVEDVSAVSCTGQVEKPLKWARFMREEGL